VESGEINGFIFNLIDIREYRITLTDVNMNIEQQNSRSAILDCLDIAKRGEVSFVDINRVAQTDFPGFDPTCCYLRRYRLLSSA
jgi:hypothetical protein